MSASKQGDVDAQGADSVDKNTPDDHNADDALSADPINLPSVRKL